MDLLPTETKTRTFVFRMDHQECGIGSPLSVHSKGAEVISDQNVLLERLLPGDFIYGLTYGQLLKVEEALQHRLPGVHVLWTGNGYGFVSREW